VGSTLKSIGFWRNKIENFGTQKVLLSVVSKKVCFFEHPTGGIFILKNFEKI
jgi:hypothetical protein